MTMSNDPQSPPPEATAGTPTPSIDPATGEPRRVVKIVEMVPPKSAAKVAAKTDTKESSVLRGILEWVLIIGIGVAAVVGIQAFVFKTFFIPSGSMQPTLQPGQRVVVSKIDHNYTRGNIVVFATPPGEAKACGPGGGNQLIKRIIGLPGETISSVGNKVLIDGQPIPEPWFPPTALGTAVKTTNIPKGEYYVMGDNREHSCDSRYWGPITKQSIIGKVVFRIWPVSKIGSVK